MLGPSLRSSVALQRRPKLAGHEGDQGVDLAQRRAALQGTLVVRSVEMMPNLAQSGLAHSRSLVGTERCEHFLGKR